MSSQSEWKQKIYKLVEQYLPSPGIADGIRSDDPEKYKYEVENEYRGTKLATQLTSCSLFTKARLKDENLFDTYLYAFCSLPSTKWGTTTRVLVTTEAFLFSQDTKKMFGSGQGSTAWMSYQELEPNRVQLQGNKLILKPMLGFALSDMVLDSKYSPKYYEFINAAHKLVKENQDLFDDALDELTGED